MEAQCFFSADKPLPTLLHPSLASRSHANTAVKLRLRRRFVGNARLASKPAEKVLAYQVFDEMPLMDTFAWNSLIQTHLLNGELRHAVFTFQQMLLRGVRPDRWTLPRALSASSRLAARGLSLGEQTHGMAIKLGFAADKYVITALLEMYGSLEGVDKAKSMVLDKSPAANSVSWTLVARMFVREGRPEAAVEMLREKAGNGAEIDRVAMATAIGAATAMRSLKDGRNFHRVARERGLEFDVLVSNSLLKMYIDCGSVEEARDMFDRMPERDLISWTEMIQAYVKKGGYNEGLKLFNRMVESGLRPDPLSFSSVLPACARITGNKQGREIHGYLVRNRVEMNLTVVNALIDMYAKSGSVECAWRMFSGLKRRDSISWTMMIMGCSLHGQGGVGVDLFREMVEESGVGEVDHFTYAAVLHACATARDVEKGRLIFGKIENLGVAHHALMVTLLANAGLFDEAANFIKEQKMDRRPEVFRALLDGCRAHGNTTLGKRVTEQLSELESLNAENYVLLSNWYAQNGKWDMVSEVRGVIRDMGLKPKKAFSWIELRNKVHVFGTGDVSHPRSEKIYAELECLVKRMEGEGLKPCTDYSLHDVEEERECVVFGHSEMLAISFGLISTRMGTTIRVTKNHRVCQFCHEAAKVVSGLTGREIVLKDPNRFHHFRGGVCSCNDFW